MAPVLEYPTGPLKTLVMGNQGSYVKDQLVDFLASYGFLVEWIINDPNHKVATQLPDACEALIFLYELQPNAHSLKPAVQKACEDKRIPFIFLSRQKSHAAVALERLGYKPRRLAQQESPPMAASKVSTVTNPDAKLAFDTRVEQLREALRALRDSHNVVRVVFDAEAACLEIIERRSTVVEV